jgi:hypothetical protein
MMKVSVFAYWHVAYIDDVDSLGRSKNYGKKGREPIL